MHCVYEILLHLKYIFGGVQDSNSASPHLSRVTLTPLVLGFLSVSKFFVSLRISSVAYKFSMWVGLSHTASAAECRDAFRLLSRCPGQLRWQLGHTKHKQANGRVVVSE